MNNQGALNLMPFKEAARKVSNPHYCFELMTVTKHVAISPKYIGSISMGIKNQLDSTLTLYSDELGGVAMAYSGIKVQENSGWLIDDYPHIHCDVTANFIVFRPTIGAIVEGTVNKLGSGFVGCIVHGIFNASLLKRRHQSVVGNCSQTSADFDQLYSQLSVSSAVTFCIDEIHVNRQVLSMTGRLMSIISASDLLVFDVPVNTVPSEIVPESPTVSQKKRKKHKTEHSAVDICLTSSVNEVERLDNAVDIGVSNKDKRRHVSESVAVKIEEPVNGDTEHDKSILIVKHKKHKQENLVNLSEMKIEETADLAENDLVPVEKHKKHKHSNKRRTIS